CGGRPAASCPRRGAGPAASPIASHSLLPARNTSLAVPSLGRVSGHTTPRVSSATQPLSCDFYNYYRTVFLLCTDLILPEILAVLDDDTLTDAAAWSIVNRNPGSAAMRETLCWGSHVGREALTRADVFYLVARIFAASNHLATGATKVATMHLRIGATMALLRLPTSDLWALHREGAYLVGPHLEGANLSKAQPALGELMTG